MSESLLEQAVRQAGPEVVYHGLTPAQRLRLLYIWEAVARPEQLEPEGDWKTWLVLAGRGYGKTRLGAEWVRSLVERNKAGRIALVAPTAADARDVMIEGSSGILSVFPPSERPTYEPSKRRITFKNGAQATAFSADEPDRLRGPQHDAAWGDELASWRYPDAWDMLMLGLRVGTAPRVVVTTTPRPTSIIRGLVKSASTHVTRGSTFDNAANLAQTFLESIRAKYEGTRLGRQELYAEILDDVEGALWNWTMIEAARIRDTKVDFSRVVVAIDPQASDGTDRTDDTQAAETGIVCVGVGRCDCKGKGKEEQHGFVLEDLSGSRSPAQWGAVAVSAYKRRKADKIIGEKNNGGAMVEHTIRTVDANASFAAVWASRGKRTRAEPVAALYEQGKVHHVGAFPLLEDQLCTWAAMSNESSPDRLDALVWGLSELMLQDDVVAKARALAAR